MFLVVLGTVREGVETIVLGRVDLCGFRVGCGGGSTVSVWGLEGGSPRVARSEGAWAATGG